MPLVYIHKYHVKILSFKRNLCICQTNGSSLPIFENLMASMNWFLFSSFLLIQLLGGSAQITWQNCKEQGNDIQLLNLTVNPHPILVPGSASVTLSIRTKQKLASPLKATFSVSKKLLFFYMPVPCSLLGTCTHDDVCAVCKQCRCPMEAGEHTVSLTLGITSNSSIVNGKYQAEIHLETSSGQKGCVKMANIDIKTK